MVIYPIHSGQSRREPQYYYVGLFIISYFFINIKNTLLLFVYLKILGI